MAEDVGLEDLIGFAASEDPAGFQQAFNALMLGRTQDAVEKAREFVAQTFTNDGDDDETVSYDDPDSEEVSVEEPEEEIAHDDPEQGSE